MVRFYASVGFRGVDMEGVKVSTDLLQGGEVLYQRNS